MRSYLCVLTILLLNYSVIKSQNIVKRDTSVKIFENGIRLNNAWSGGLNSAQFSEIDLNLDGVMDLFIFDKSGNKISPFVNKNGQYEYAPIYRKNFPLLHDWVILNDFNCDGKQDIFTYSTGGMAVYKNISTNNLEFEIVTNLVLSDYGSTNLNIYISPVDIPAIEDIDYDGDLDILTFSILGGFVEFHKNMSIELTGSCDTIAYQKQEDCWGLFYEGLNSYILNCANCQCPAVNGSLNNFKTKHAGSTLLAIDIDNDLDKDLILGDISYNNLNLLINGGDNQNAIMTSVDSVFPQNYNNTLPLDLNVYPAAYYLDVTHDGVKDLLISTNSENNSANFKSCWLYENTNQNSLPSFNYIKEDFLQDDMIDVGKGANPVFFDYNDDGLKDIIIGNYGYHQDNDNPISSLALLENIGTLSDPKFNLVDRDWLSLSNLNLNTTLNLPALNLSPAFGDLDNDGQEEMVIGDADGKLHYFDNQNNNFIITNPNFFNIDVGYFAQPEITDVNRDGLMDLIIGEQGGTINYFQNRGSLINPIFDTIIENFGGIDIEDSVTNTGYSSPKMIDSSGVYHLYVGSNSGKIYKFTNIENNLNGQFTEVTSTFSNIWDGGRSVFSLSDINNDQNIDLIIGNISGGISFFNSDSLIVSYEIEKIQSNKILIYPNPCLSEFQINSKTNGMIYIYDLLGDIVLEKEKLSDKITINHSLNSGIYILKLNSISKKIIIK